MLPLLCLLATSCASLRAPFDAGMVASRDKTPEGHSRLRALGPFFERQETGGKTFTAVRPFYSRTVDPANERCLQEYLWPVAMDKDLKAENFWRVLLAYGQDFDRDDPDSRYRCIVFPFVYVGKDVHGENYFAVFPIGGKVNEFLGRDKIWFALFPLYMYSAINDVKTYDVIWPFISWTDDDDVSRFRVFPFYGRSIKEGQWRKKFVLWPIWTSADYAYPDGQTGGGFVLFPLFGHTKLTDQESWMLLPPFFRWSWNDKGYRSGNTPWPFVQYSHGKGRDEKLYLWPLWGTRYNDNYRSSFFLWPIGSSLEVNRADHTLDRFTLFPLVFYEKKTPKTEVRGQRSEIRGQPPSPDGSGVPGKSEVSQESGDRGQESGTIEQRTEDGGQPPSPEGYGVPGRTEVRSQETEGIDVHPTTDGRYFKLWPVVSYLREGDASRLRFLDLWPGKQLSVVERNFAPFWTLYSHVRVDGAGEDELLWGLFRRSHDSEGGRHMSLFPLFSCGRSPAEDSREWSLLWGLTGYHREGLRRTYRVLYFFKFSTNEGA